MTGRSSRRRLLQWVAGGLGATTLPTTDLASGQTDDRLLWKFETGGRFSSPTVVDGTVYHGDPTVYALDAATGEQQWAFETGADVNSSPTVVDGTVYVGSSDDNLYALDAQTGVQRWAFETGGRIHSSPTVVDGTVYVGSRDNNLHALDAQTGVQRWAFETGHSVRSSPTVVDGTIYVGSRDNNVYALDADTNGSSEGSRVNLGTLGHHHAWAPDAEDSSENDPEVIDPQFEYTPEQPTTNDTIVLDASELTADEEVIRYQWDFGNDGTIDERGEVVSAEFDDGPTIVALTVRTVDDTRRTTVETIRVEGTPSITPTFDYSPEAPVTGEPVEFDASESVAENTAIDAYEWDFTGDGSADQTGPVAVHSFEAGVHPVRLTIRGEDGTEAIDEQTIEVDPDQLNLAITASKERLDPDEQVIIEYSVNNFLTSRDLTIQLLVERDGQLDVVGIDNGRSAGNQFTAIATLGPGEQDVIRIHLEPREPGEYEVEAIADYYFGDDRSDGSRTSETLVFAVGHDESEENEDESDQSSDGTDGSSNTTDEATDDSIPGMGVTSAIGGLGSAAYLIARRIRKAGTREQAGSDE